MNQDHVLGAAVTGAPSATVMLAGTLQHFQTGVDAATAGCEAGLIVLGVASLGAAARWFITWKWPSAPPPPPIPPTLQGDHT